MAFIKFISDVWDNKKPHNFDNCAAVQTRAMKQRKLKPPKPLKVSSIDGLYIGPDQLTEQQRTDETLKRYWRLVDKPSVEGKPQFVVKKRILYRKLKTKCGVEYKMQLVVSRGKRRGLAHLSFIHL